MLDGTVRRVRQGAMDPGYLACLDRWTSLLLTDNASPGSSDGIMPRFLVEEGRGSSRAMLATARPSC